MSWAVLKALSYKSFSIYRTRYIVTAAEILWPCLLLLLVAKLTNVDNESNHPSQIQDYEDTTPSFLVQQHDPQVQNDGSIAYAEPANESDAYFTEATFRRKFLAGDSLYKESNRIKRSPENNSKNQVLREVCSIQYSFVVIICFLGAWTGAGLLAQAERMSGTVERMRMYGTSDLYIVFSYVMHAGFKQVITTLICAIIVKSHVFGEPLISNIDYFVVFCGMLVVSIHSTVYFLTVASFFNSSILRSIVGTFSYFYFFLWAVRQNFSVTGQVFGCLFAPFFTVITMITACGFEHGGGVSWKSLVSSGTGVNELPLLLMLLLMIIGSFIFLFIFYYMMNVKPGPYGSAMPVFFILPQFLVEKCSSFLSVNESKIESDMDFRKGLYEEVPQNIKIGIKIENLFKKYGNITSVKNLSLNVYFGQITALLGHNGAGKTTTLSILSGMLSPTSGSAFYQEYNIFTNLRQFRKDLGLCPQNNLLHPNLKVINQLIFFGMLGGLSRKEALESANKLLKVVGIYEKRNGTVKEMSGGMKRKLCIALALLGNPSIVILDEPTSGVDPESRREIWNVLLEAREKKIMLITTHFMEEADALGDQIAIMNHGELVCYGSPMFLKKHYGAGYHVTISCKPQYFSTVSEIVIAEIPEATVIGEHEEWIKFKLPFNKAEHFPNLFQFLESDDNIARIGVSCTTMEDVYLKVEEEAGGEMPSVPKMSHVRVQQTTSKNSKLMAYFNRFLGLVKKNSLYTWRKWFIIVLLVVIVPPIAAYISWNEYNTDFDAYNGNKTQNYDSPSSHDPVETKERSFNGGGKKNFTLMKGSLRTEHSHNQELAEILNSINTCFQENDPYLYLRVYIFTMWISMVIFVVSCTFATLVHDERISSVKHLILMTGLSPITYWISIFLWDLVVYLVFTILSWFTLIMMDTEQLFERDSGMYILFIIIFLAGLSMISSVYFVSLLLKTLRAVVVFYLSGVFTFGFISYFILGIKKIQPYGKILKLQPLTSTMFAINDFMMLAEKKHKCKQCHFKDCAEILKSSYFKDENLSEDLIFLVVDVFFYLVLIILTDYGLFSFIWDKIKSCYIGSITNSGLKDVDSDVAREKMRVGATRDTTDRRNEPIAIVDGLAKKFSHSMVAVYDVTFAVSKGECFGLLGVNGAGKSTTFNMLTGVLYPTVGNVFLKGHSLNKNKSMCLSLIGYCPQHSALVESLTGRQMLDLFAKLRLVPPENIKQEVNKWISLFGLDEYCDRVCGTYSGGNKRKLNTAMAFIGDPSLILLDEPTSGVDPFIRRNLWGVIDACSSTNQAIIISSHSMDECEAVCDRLTIMVKGRMECIGNTQHLKALYGTGYVIMIKLKAHTADELAVLKNKMQSMFASDCVLKDEHPVLLHYHIGTNVRSRSQLFNIMEHIKKQLNIVDDYVITDASLEDVFLSFAKKQNE